MRLPVKVAFILFGVFFFHSTLFSMLYYPQYQTQQRAAAKELQDAIKQKKVWPWVLMGAGVSLWAASAYANNIVSLATKIGCASKEMMVTGAVYVDKKAAWSVSPKLVQAMPYIKTGITTGCVIVGLKRAYEYMKTNIFGSRGVNTQKTQQEQYPVGPSSSCRAVAYRSRGGEQQIDSDVLSYVGDDVEIPMELYQPTMTTSSEEIKRLAVRLREKNEFVRAIFHGVSGAGKTRTAMALAAFSGRKCRLINIPLLANRYTEYGVTHLTEILAAAVREDPSVLLILDEADRLNVPEKFRDSFAYAVTSFIDLCDREYRDVAIIVTMNAVDHVDLRVLDRFGHRTINIPLPSQEARLQVIQKAMEKLWSEGYGCSLEERVQQRLAAQTDGFSFRNILELFDTAKRFAEDITAFDKYKAMTPLTRSSAQKNAPPKPEIKPAHIQEAFELINGTMQHKPSRASALLHGVARAVGSIAAFITPWVFYIATQEIINRRSEARADVRLQCQ